MCRWWCIRGWYSTRTNPSARSSYRGSSGESFLFMILSKRSHKWDGCFYRVEATDYDWKFFRNVGSYGQVPAPPGVTKQKKFRIIFLCSFVTPLSSTTSPQSLELAKNIANFLQFFSRKSCRRRSFSGCLFRPFPEKIPCTVGKFCLFALVEKTFFT